jgi:hypothetical protein
MMMQPSEQKSCIEGTPGLRDYEKIKSLSVSVEV